MIDMDHKQSTEVQDKSFTEWFNSPMVKIAFEVDVTDKVKRNEMFKSICQAAFERGFATGSGHLLMLFLDHLKAEIEQTDSSDSKFRN